MRNIIFGFLLAFSYFSILPIKLKVFRESPLIYKSTLFFIPFVGFIIGILTLIIFLFLSNFFNIYYASLLSAIFYLFLYGFLHLEAIVDVVDGYYASLSNKDIYKIMKEPTVGAIGVIAIILFLILKIASIVYLLNSENIFKILVAFTLSRFSIFYIFYFFKLHNKSIFALKLQKNLTIKFFIFSILLYSLLLLIFIDLSILIMLLFATIFFTILIIKILKKRINFINGDILGFNIELIELILINILILI